MSRDPGAWVPHLVAVATLAAVVVQTLGALEVTGALGRRPAASRAVVAPAFQSLDRALDRRDPAFTFKGLRDPFADALPIPVGGQTHPPRRARAKPDMAPAPAPLLTAIVWDNDPRALVRWKGREWTVREGGLFDEFHVLTISRDQVILRRGDSSLVLQRRNPGD